MKRWLLTVCVVAAMGGGWLSHANAEDELTFATPVPVGVSRLEACEICDGCRCESREARSDRRPVVRWVSSNQPVRRVTRIAGRVAVGVLPGR